MSDGELWLRVVAVVGLILASCLAYLWNMRSVAEFLCAWTVGLSALTAYRLKQRNEP